jgi:calcineurin-like phosphoesterase family protein
MEAGMSSFVRKFYISDPHFMHAAMLTMQPRPFSTIEEHDETIIENWNSVVGERDLVHVLGDFSMKLTEREDRVREIFKALKGRKILVIGNHDVDKHFRLHPTLASLPWDNKPEFMRVVKDGGHRLVLCHYGIREWQGRHSGAFHFYGHAHGRLAAEGRSRDVGVDMPDVWFKPRTFEELTAGMSDQD